jgi:hypothetical protein
MASSVLAGQFWQTPPELKGANFAPAHIAVNLFPKTNEMQF